jgi:hypothetical protein
VHGASEIGLAVGGSGGDGLVKGIASFVDPFLGLGNQGWRKLFGGRNGRGVLAG